ncbi:hypothetical protein D3C87_1862670 [compost metagenome]
MMMILRMLLTSSMTFFIENMFLTPLIGLSFLKPSVGLRGLRVRSTPTWSKLPIQVRKKAIAASGALQIKMMRQALSRTPRTPLRS